MILFLLCTVIGVRAAIVDTIAVKTSYIESPAKVTIVLPEDAKHQSKEFPTLYLLHGYGGDYTNWYKRCPELADLSDRYGIIIVMPDGRDSWYWDWPNNPKMQMESFFVEDLVPYIDANYPTRNEASQRAISGLSMGGHGAMWLAIRHSDVWANAGTMSGGVDIRPFPNNWKISKAIGKLNINPELWDSYTVMGIIEQLKPGQLNITIDCGIDDFFIDVNRNLHKKLLDAGIAHDYTERPGKHNWQYWTNSVLYHILFFNEAFNR